MSHVLRPQGTYSPCIHWRAHTFTTQGATIGNKEGERDSSAKQEGEGEMEPSADKEVKASGGTDQTIEYIIHLIYYSLHQGIQTIPTEKNRSCFGCWSPNYLMWDCPKDISKCAQRVDLNTKEGMAKKGGWAIQQTSPDETPSAKRHCERLPFWIWTHTLVRVDPKNIA